MKAAVVRIAAMVDTAIFLQNRVLLLKPLGPLAAYDHFILIEFTFKAAAQFGPPIAIYRLGHNLDDGDVVTLGCLTAFPSAFRR